ARLRKAIDDAGVQRRLHHSELVMEAAFRATSALSKAAAQKAVNAALKVLENALKQALPG
ncbi:MAG: hypothetical protein ISR76_03500, partial [Planctomycetes bacterium]|nr:hypothetical protein [Planctomycetota bacterium]